MSAMMAVVVYADGSPFADVISTMTLTCLLS